MGSHYGMKSPKFSYEATIALASLFDAGLQRVDGTLLTGHHSQCFLELIESGALHPDAPLRLIGDEGNETESLQSILQSHDGTLVYITEDGPITPPTGACRQYLFDADWLMTWLNKELGLSGHPHRLIEGTYDLGTLMIGKQPHIIYYTRRLSLVEVKQLETALSQRPNPLPATILYGPLADKPPTLSVANTQYQPFVESLFNARRLLDPHHFHQCIQAHFLPSATEEGFVWLPNSGTFLFPDQQAVHFRPGHSATLVNILVQHWRTGDPWINEQYLLQDLLRCRSQRIRDLLKRVENWQDVVQLERGWCRLRIPLAKEQMFDGLWIEARGENNNNCTNIQL